MGWQKLDEPCNHESMEKIYSNRCTLFYFGRRRAPESKRKILELKFKIGS